MVGAYSQLESITANDAITAPSSDGPKTLATFISEIARQLRLIIGGADWFTAPPTSLTSLNTNKAALAGATFTGTVNVSSGGLQKAGKDVIFAQAGLTGKWAAQSTAPTSPADGDLWLDISVVLS
jgi:hypothetical protein